MIAPKEYALSGWLEAQERAWHEEMDRGTFEYPPTFLAIDHPMSHSALLYFIACNYLGAWDRFYAHPRH